MQEFVSYQIHFIFRASFRRWAEGRGGDDRAGQKDIQQTCKYIIVCVSSDKIYSEMILLDAKFVYFFPAYQIVGLKM